MNSHNALFRRGDLAATLNGQLQKIANAVASWDEDSLLSTPERDICGSLEQEFLIEPLALDRAGITMESVTQSVETVRDFDEMVDVDRTVVTVSVPFAGEPRLFDLKPSTRTFTAPSGVVSRGELRLQCVGPVDRDARQVKHDLDSQLDNIEKYVKGSADQVKAYNESAAQKIATEVQARRARILENRNLQEALGYPLRRRPDAATYSVPISRKKIVPRRPAPASEPFRPEPVLDDSHYESALEVLRNQRNQLERSPSISSHLKEEQIRDLLLIGLNSQFEGRAAGEVFNYNGKTDILIREGDRHVFIGECKIWKSPKTITDTLDQLLSYLVWRDTKSALLLFIRSGSPAEIIDKAVAKVREHPNYKRDGQNATDERHDFVFRSKDDPNREIKLAFLPFYLPKPKASG
ncbi:hypothetical protein [Streptomyces ochraceiscleroticus]|uniref:Restriction endonuclease type IV Mrr domain-containing protein n=1 Tax=Streptomyces ochraceiscleroticus TaxID=47761 RepID=A0ABW1MEK3_9ACTN|nr:hypothetical protein [Streptomyces ochraceiscleroticus]